MGAPLTPPAHKPSPLGYVPGLGHPRRGDWPNAIGLSVQVLILLWAAVAGFPRLGGLLFPEQGGSGLHPWIALLSWVGVLGLVGYTTWAGQQPPPPKDAVRSPTAEHAPRAQDRVGGGAIEAVAGAGREGRRPRPGAAVVGDAETRLPGRPIGVWRPRRPAAPP